jgi:hypothetical protein
VLRKAGLFDIHWLALQRSPDARNEIMKLNLIQIFFSYLREDAVGISYTFVAPPSSARCGSLEYEKRDEHHVVLYGFVTVLISPFFWRIILALSFGPLGGGDQAANAWRRSDSSNLPCHLKQELLQFQQINKPGCHTPQMLASSTVGGSIIPCSPIADNDRKMNQPAGRENAAPSLH